MLKWIFKKQREAPNSVIRVWLKMQDKNFFSVSAKMNSSLDFKLTTTCWCKFMQVVFCCCCHGHGLWACGLYWNLHRAGIFPSLCLSLCHTPLWSGCVSTGTVAPRALSSCAAKLIITTDYTSSQQPWHFQGRWHDDKIILEMRHHSHSLSRPLSLQSSFDFYVLLISGSFILLSSLGFYLYLVHCYNSLPIFSPSFFESPTLLL